MLDIVLKISKKKISYVFDNFSRTVALFRSHSTCTCTCMYTACELHKAQAVNRERATGKFALKAPHKQAALNTMQINNYS